MVLTGRGRIRFVGYNYIYAGHSYSNTFKKKGEERRENRIMEHGGNRIVSKRKEDEEERA